MSHVLPKSMQNYCTFSWSSPTVCPDGSGHVLLPWLDYKCEGKLLHVAVSTQPVFGISLECSLTSYLWLATHWTPLYSTRQTNQRSVSLTDIRVTAGILKLLRQNSHLDQTLVTFLWWVQVSSFYKPSGDSKRESAMPRIIQPFSSRTRSGLQYFSPNVISAACSFPFVLQSNLWGMSPCLHSIISYFFKGLNFRYPYPT